MDSNLSIKMWHVLGGPYFGHITLNNLRMLLLAIKGLHVRPETEITPEDPIIRMKDVLSVRKIESDVPTFKKETPEKKSQEYLFGFFNENGDFYLDEVDVEIAGKWFKPINTNRMFFE